MRDDIIKRLADLSISRIMDQIRWNEEKIAKSQDDKDLCKEYAGFIEEYEAEIKRREIKRREKAHKKKTE